MLTDQGRGCWVGMAVAVSKNKTALKFAASVDSPFHEPFLGSTQPQCCLITFYTTLELSVAPHPSPLAWKIPWMEEPGGLQSMGSLRVGHD